MVVCDKWVAVKIFEVIFCISCLVCKRVTDDEAVRLNLYLQKLSREWSLLRNITWSSIGASFGDAIYGGYVIITFGLLLGRVFREIPRGRRVLEGFLLGIGALFFIVLGGLELASVDSIPEGLIDNAAVLGVLSLMTAVLFLIDLAGPRKIDTSKHCQTDAEKNTFSYPKLPQENKNDDKKPAKEANTTLKTNKAIEKVKKPNKKEEKIKKLANDNAEKLESPKLVNSIQESENDEVDKFISSQNPGYHKFNENRNDDGIAFESVEKSKYGSLRNGVLKDHKENEAFQKTNPAYRINSKDLEIAESNMRKMQYDEDLSKNIAYLKLLDEKNALEQKLNEKQYNSEAARLRDQYMRDYKHNMVLPIENDKRNHPHMGISSRAEYDRQKKWEAFEEPLPPFSIREDYLPELQTPVFSKVKDNYGAYDNYANYNIPNRRPESTQTDSLRSKTSTLKSKPPTLQQIAEYFGLEQKRAQKATKKEAGSQADREELPIVSFMLPMSPIKESREVREFNGEPTSPTDPGYVQYTAQNWHEKLSRKSTRTPRHSPTDD